MTIAEEIILASHGEYSESVLEIAKAFGGWFNAELCRCIFPDGSYLDYDPISDNWFAVGFCSEHECCETECATHAHYPAKEEA